MAARVTIAFTIKNSMAIYWSLILIILYIVIIIIIFCGWLFVLLVKNTAFGLTKLFRIKEVY